jgi:hypothetical protein
MGKLYQIMLLKQSTLINEEIFLCNTYLSDSLDPLLVVSPVTVSESIILTCQTP